MKRFILVLAVAALMAAMVVVLSVPAFAAGRGNGTGTQECRLDLLSFGDTQRRASFECTPANNNAQP